MASYVYTVASPHAGFAIAKVLRAIVALLPSLANYGHALVSVIVRCGGMARRDGVWFVEMGSGV